MKDSQRSAAPTALSLPAVQLQSGSRHSGEQVAEMGAQQLECQSCCLPLAARLQRSCQRCGRCARADVEACRALRGFEETYVRMQTSLWPAGVTPHLVIPGSPTNRVVVLTLYWEMAAFSELCSNSDSVPPFSMGFDALAFWSPSYLVKL